MKKSPSWVAVERKAEHMAIDLERVARAIAVAVVEAGRQEGLPDAARFTDARLFARAAALDVLRQQLASLTAVTPENTTIREFLLEFAAPLEQP